MMRTPFATLPVTPAVSPPGAATSAALVRLGRELGACALLGVVALPVSLLVALPLAARFGPGGFVGAYLAGGVVVRAALGRSALPPGGRRG